MNKEDREARREKERKNGKYWDEEARSWDSSG